MKYVITKRDRAILIALFGILVLAGVYYFVYMGYKDKTAQLKATNQAIQNRVDVLQSIADQQAELVSQTNSNNEMVEKILKRFPANIYEEDVILFAQALQEFTPFEVIPSVGIGAPAERFTFSNISAETSEVVNGYIPAEVGDSGPAPAPAEGEAPAAEGDAALAEVEAAPAPVESGPAPEQGATPVLYSRTVSLSGQTDYDGFKNALRFVVDNIDRSKLVVNASYDISTGMLQTSMNIDRYYATGTGKAYIEPEINNVIQGTENIFGTISLSELRPNDSRTHTEEEESGAENAE